VEALPSATSFREGGEDGEITKKIIRKINLKEQGKM
jgi:hypothetical protein